MVCNVDAKPVEDAESAREALVRQVTGSVKWSDSMQLLISRGVQTFIEVGPGKVLCGLLRQIDRSKKCLNVEDEASLQKTTEYLIGEALLTILTPQSKTKVCRSRRAIN